MRNQMKNNTVRVFSKWALISILLIFSLACKSQVFCSNYKFPISRKSIDTSALNRGTFDKLVLWEPGRTLRIKFLDGSDTLKALVKKIAPEWTNYANIKFEFTQQDPSDVRISFDLTGSWSALGKNAQKDGLYQATMSLSDVKDYVRENYPESDSRGTILHEFGHVLGLEHEHQSPYRGFQWKNKDSVYAYFSKPPNNWDKADVDRNVFDVMDKSNSNGEYDGNSIMHYSLPRELLVNNYVTHDNYELSTGDIKTISALYPKKESPGVKDPEPESTPIYAGILYVNGNNLEIFPVFTIQNGIGTTLLLRCYFYNAEGKPLVNETPGVLKLNYNNQVVAENANQYVTESPADFNTTNLQSCFFVPMTDLLLKPGKNKIKYQFEVYIQGVKLLMRSKMFSGEINL